MVIWFWYFLIYSFLGFLMEVGYARLVHDPKRDRKCRYLLPLCPVYGLGCVLILLLDIPLAGRPMLLIPCAALTATAAEYGASLFYEKVMRVSFWDYSHLPLNLGGRVCLLYAGLWLLLIPALLYLAQPGVAFLAAHIPPVLALPAALLFALDTAYTILLLRKTRSTESLRWYLHVRNMRPFS